MRFLAILLVALPGFAFAAGSGGGGGGGSSSSSSGNDSNTAGGTSFGAPKTTKTTTECTGNQVWDGAKCVNSYAPEINDLQRIEAIRELSYNNRLEDAQDILNSLENKRSDIALTYWGFTHRKLGNLELAGMFYRDAIEANPDNILARSYMGQGFVEQGRTDEALVQWKEIKARGGTDTWAELSLREALRTGVTYNY